MGQMTYPELLVGFDEKMELGRAVWWRLLSSLVVNSWRETGKLVSYAVWMHTIVTPHLCLSPMRQSYR